MFTFIIIIVIIIVLVFISLIWKVCTYNRHKQSLWSWYKIWLFICMCYMHSAWNSSWTLEIFQTKLLVQLKHNITSAWSLLTCYSNAKHMHSLFTMLSPSQVLKLCSKYHSTFKLRWILFKGMLFQLKPHFVKLYIALLTYYHVHLFCWTEASIVFSFVKIMLPCWIIKSASQAKEENLYRSKLSFTVNELWQFFIYSARTIK